MVIMAVVQQAAFKENAYVLKSGLNINFIRYVKKMLDVADDEVEVTACGRSGLERTLHLLTPHNS